MLKLATVPKLSLQILNVGGFIAGADRGADKSITPCDSLQGPQRTCGLLWLGYEHTQPVR